MGSAACGKELGEKGVELPTLVFVDDCPTNWIPVAPFFFF